MGVESAAEKAYIKRYGELKKAHPAFEHRADLVEARLRTEWEVRGINEDLTFEMTRALKIAIDLDKEIGRLPTYDELVAWDDAGRPEPFTSPT